MIATKSVKSWTNAGHCFTISLMIASDHAVVSSTTSILPFTSVYMSSRGTHYIAWPERTILPIQWSSFTVWSKNLTLSIYSPVIIISLCIIALFFSGTLPGSCATVLCSVLHTPCVFHFWIMIWKPYLMIYGNPRFLTSKWVIIESPHVTVFS